MAVWLEEPEELKNSIHEAVSNLRNLILILKCNLLSLSLTVGEARPV